MLRVVRGVARGASLARAETRRRARAFLFVLTRREQRVLTALVLLLILSGVWLLSRGYTTYTERVPAVGGTYTEGIVGQPRFVNPVFVATNDVDRDLARLVFSGLMKYTPEGTLVPDLAERYEVTEDGKTYTFFLREGLSWHDGQALTADDVVFTVSLIQNPLVQSPLKANWQGVKVEKLDALRVQFTLATPYAPFLENTTVGIIPKHLWGKVPLESLRLAEPNLRPIGSGPFAFERFRKDSFGGIHSFTLSRFADAKPEPPYVKTLVLRFFGQEADLLKAFRTGEVDGLALGTNQLRTEVTENGTNGTAIHSITLPRYFAVFFNQSHSKALVEKAVRRALSDATDRSQIVEKLLGGYGVALEGPIPPGLAGFHSSTTQPPFSSPESSAGPPVYAEIIQRLEREGWRDSDGDGVREKKAPGEKSATPLTITLATSDFPDLRAIAELLKNQWQAVGAKIELAFFPLAELERTVLRPRQYDALLFGEILSLEPDPFAFWHSTQKRDPGLNLALYENRAVDRLLEEARITLDPAVRRAKLQEFAKLVQDDIPAIFLYAPQFLYLQPKELKGSGMKIIALPSERFADVTRWYMETERRWKK